MENVPPPPPPSPEELALAQLKKKANTVKTLKNASNFTPLPEAINSWE
jgi:hypothetical protein